MPGEWDFLRSPMTFDVDRIVDSQGAAVMLASRMVGAVNSDQWDGFGPGTLKVLRLTICSLGDWRHVSLRFRIEFTPGGFDMTDPYEFATSFAEMLSVGRHPKQRPEATS